MTFTQILIALVAGGGASVIAGCLSGLALGHKKIDTVLAGMMGMFYGALAGFGVLFAVIILTIF